MSGIKTDEAIPKWRAMFFPFFDDIEKVFVLLLMTSESFLFYFLDIKNDWIIPVGSWLGLLLVGWSTLPSSLIVDGYTIDDVKSILRNSGMEEKSRNRFEPKTLGLAGWPRNFVKVLDGQYVKLIGPRSLLRNFEVLVG
ncbi:MAG TPA: hypothetical protein VFK50_09370 [Sphingomicrobium sp.]|nr:hypothetical protein [Sphingomicrobium sp.]